MVMASPADDTEAPSDGGADTTPEASDTAPEQESDEKEMKSDVPVPEAFQRTVQSICANASRPQLEYLRSCVMEREKELMKSETKPEKSATFDTEGMPE